MAVTRPKKLSIRFSEREKTGEVLDQVREGRGKTKRFWIVFSTQRVLYRTDG